VVWEDETPGNFEIHFIKSADRGATWKPIQRLTYTSGDSWDPAIAVNASSIYLVWVDYAPGYISYPEIYFGKSADGGATWKPIQRLTYNSVLPGDPSITVNGSNIYVVWPDSKPGNREIYLKYTTVGNSMTPLKKD
jgi:hypothetical protein